MELFVWNRKPPKIEKRKGKLQITRFKSLYIFFFDHFLDILDLQVCPASRVYQIRQVKRVQGRPKKTWMEVIRQDIEATGLNEGILLDRNE